MHEEKRARDYYLKDFRIENDVEELGYPKEVEEVAKEIVSIIKNRDLRYVDAYASLQWARNKLKYESNFTNTQ